MEVPASEHRLVALAIMETYVRYTRVLQHALHCLPAVLQTFLGARGIGHPDKESRALSCDMLANPQGAQCLALPARHVVELSGEPRQRPAQ